MGFIGKLRKIVRPGSLSQPINVSQVSNDISAAARTLNLTDIQPLFSTSVIKSTSNGKAALGNLDLDEFVTLSRRGDYKSFERAFEGTNTLANSNVQNTVKKVLAEAATELPDSRLYTHAENAAKLKSSYGLEASVNTVGELEQLVKSNSRLAGDVDKLVASGKRTGKLKFLGYTVAVSAATLTAALVYQTCIEKSQESTGCFIYTMVNGEPLKCKVSSMSCKYPGTGGCTTPSSITSSTLCGSDTTTVCHDKCATENYTGVLEDNQVMRCEKKSASDVLVETLVEAGVGVTNSIGKIFSGIFGGVWKYVLIAVGVILLVVFVPKFLGR